MNLFRLKDSNCTNQKFNRSALLLVALVVACFAISPMAQAVVPAPDGGYPGGNTAEGQSALLSLSSGGYNTAVGFLSLKSDATGSFNTGVGAGTLLANTADSNTAVGAAALLLNTIGTENTATGVAALALNDTGSENTANGAFALSSNTEGEFNTANGAFALFSNTTGAHNTAIGSLAVFHNTTGTDNTAIGDDVLFLTTTGYENTAIGSFAAAFNETGFQNTAIGFAAANNNETGFRNTAVGYQALLNNDGGSGNTALGYLAGSNLTIGDDNICIGNDGVAGDAGVIRIGRNFINSTYIAGISGQTASGGAAVYVASDGKLGTNTSSARFKDEIKPMDRASEVILALHPVSFRYKKEIDPRGIPQFGLVAEEVHKVNPDLVIRDQQGKPHMVRYEQINAMLLNEFLKEHRKNEEQEATMARLQKQIEALATDLQKVSAQQELTKAPQVVATNP